MTDDLRPSVSLWEERGRIIITLFVGDREIASWIDDEAREMFVDGFFSKKDVHGSVIGYAEERGLIPTQH